MSATLLMDEITGVSHRSEFDLAEIVEQGLPVESLNRLKEHGVTFTELSEIVIAPRTLKHRKARGEDLSHEETDRVIRVARVITLANDVFGNNDKALKWLRTPADRIDGRTPFSMLRTDAGGRWVESRLWQIDEGVFV